MFGVNLYLTSVPKDMSSKREKYLHLHLFVDSLRDVSIFVFSIEIAEYIYSKINSKKFGDLFVDFLNDSTTTFYKKKI